MKKLISGIEILARKYNIGYFNLSNIQIDKYNIGINIIEKENLYKIRFRINPNENLLSNDLRNKILKNIDGLFLLTKENNKGIKIENLKNFLEKEGKKEEEIIQEYIKNFNLKKEEAMYLYKFFDPNPVVAGLTEEEIRLCLFFYPLREQQKSLYPIFFPPFIHKNLINNPTENVSRTKGLKDAIYEIVMDLMKKKSVINYKQIKPLNL